MTSRIELQALLLTLCDNVYFQPPPTVKMVYPCIRYERSDDDTRFADDKPYSHAKRYIATVIDQDPDGEISDKVRQLRYCRFDRFYTADELNHDVFQLFF